MEWIGTVRLASALGLRACPAPIAVRPPPVGPNYDRVLAAQLNASYGALTPEYYSACPREASPACPRSRPLLTTPRPAAAVSDVLAIVQTGDVHAAVYDLTDQFLYVRALPCARSRWWPPVPSRAAPSQVSFEATAASSVPTPFNAYDRQFTRLDLKTLFAEPRPPM